MSAMGSSREGCLWVSAVVAVILLALAAVGWSIAMDRGLKLTTAEGNLAVTREQLDKLLKDLDAAKASLNKATSDIAEGAAALQKEKARAGALERKLQATEGPLRDRAAQIAGLEKRVVELSGENRRLTAALKTTTQRYETARQAASGKADLLDRIEAANAKIAELEQQVAEERKSAAAIEAARKELEARLQKAMADIAERDEMMKKLRDELADIPVMPLPDELAEQKYRDFLKKVAEHTDRESRVGTLFRAKLALAGSAYESKADTAWRREMRRKQEDVDRAARAVYGDVTSKIRIHATAHDENVKLLVEALEKVRGSRYEKVIQQLIDREHELNAVGR